MHKIAYMYIIILLHLISLSDPSKNYKIEKVCHPLRRYQKYQLVTEVSMQLYLCSSFDLQLYRLV